MGKPRSCPNCKKEIGLDKGFRFDDNLNLVCVSCGKIAFQTHPQSFVSPSTRVDVQYFHTDRAPFA